MKIYKKGHNFENQKGIIGIYYSENDAYFGTKIAYNAVKSIWLPRQGQLQAMITNSVPIGLIKVMFNKIYGVVEPKLGFDYYSKFKSMEQLWLAFVMKEKYNKFWNDKEWLEVEDAN